MLTNEEKRELVREDFSNDDINELVGFLEVENDIGDYPDFDKEKTLVVYIAHTGEIAYETLDDMVGFTLINLKDNTFITEGEAREIAKAFINDEDIINNLIDLGLPVVITKKIINTAISKTEKDVLTVTKIEKLLDEKYENFLEALDKFVTIVWEENCLLIIRPDLGKSINCPKKGRGRKEMSIIETAIKKRRQLLKGKRFDHDKARWESFLEYW